MSLTCICSDIRVAFAIYQVGFFVIRPSITWQEVDWCDFLEVYHVRTDWLGGEKGVSWFFNTIGSGVFLPCDGLPRGERVAQFRNRAEWEAQHGRDWPGDDNILGVMEQEGLAMMVFRAADFTVFDTTGHNPSTEIIIRHRERDSSEMWSPRGSCLDDDDVGIPLRTGIGGALPCVCTRYGGGQGPPIASTNCDGTPTYP